MPTFSIRRLFDSVMPRSAERRASAGRIESCPPEGWRASRGWTAPLGQRRRHEAVASARLDFADALIDVRSQRAILTLERIAVARSLHDLWELRETVFALVSQRHDQAEADRRLAALDRHFPRRIHRFAPATRRPPTR